MANEQRLMAKRVELLGIWTGRVDGQPHVLMSLRTDTSSFQVSNIALSASQARRLLDDLASRFQESAFLKGIESPDPGLRVAYERIISQDPNVSEQ